MFYFMIAIALALKATSLEGRYYAPTTPDYQKCKFGRYQADLGNEELCNPWSPNCVEGYNCQGGPGDQPGPCCKALNPCKDGLPYTRNGDAPNCIKNGVNRCPNGYACAGTKQTSSVCCKGCTYEGSYRFPSEEFYNNRGQYCTCGNDGQVACNAFTYCPYKNNEYPIGKVFQDGCKTCTCNPNGHVTCTDTYCSVYCNHGGQQYTYGQPKFPKGDGCNECTCNKDGTVSCTKKLCQVYCHYNGKQYSPGQSFTSIDGCNRCTCQENGQVSCGNNPCNPYPGDNPYAG